MRIKALLVPVVLGLAMLWGPAQAQESAFAAYAEPLRFATASHLLELRLEALAAMPGDAEVDADDDEGPPIPLLALFAGSLAAADAGLLQAIETELDDVERLAGTDDEAALEQAVKGAQQHLAQAREVLVPAEVSGDPAFQAALIAELAISERGLGEGYEEAAGGEIGAYPLAWFTLQRVQAIWAELKPELDAPGDGAERALDELNALMPTLQPPDRFHDPEDAEGAALDLVFALEGALGRPVLIRGFAPTLDLMQQQTGAACAAVRDGRGRLALEQALAARITYSAHLASTLSTLAPDVHGDLSALWTELDTLRSGDGAEQTCSALQDAVARAGAVFG